MKLSIHGPDIPVSFLNRLQDDKVVFFCGAGVSMRSGLPDFKNLVKKLFSEYNEQFNGRRYDYDQMLEELESKYKGVRNKVRQILAPSENVSDRRLENHCNLLRLASVGGDANRVRLVTTNFDDRFQRAAKLKKMSVKLDDSPKLPMPEDGEEWTSLVHLHGRISEEDQTLKSLVLTSSDFGRAYLVQGWARRFVVQLLREWHVVFVGYGLNDPMLRYLMDATAAIRQNNKNSFKDSYAFAPCRAGREDETRNIWKKKGVTVPIPYCKGISAGAHSPLWKTLGDIANLKENHIHSRTYFALAGTELMPEKDNAERVIWALEKPVIAEEFAQQKNIEDGDKFIRWLNAFKEAGLFRADDAAPVDMLNYPQHSLYGASNLPQVEVARYLAWWAARHARQPALLWWLVSSREKLHPRFISQIHECVNQDVAGKKIPDELAERWNLYLQGQSASPHFGLWLGGFSMKLEWVTSCWEQLIIAALRPWPRVIPCDSLLLIEEQKRFKTEVTVDCEMGGNDFRMYSAKKHAKKAKFAMTHAEALAAHMETAASLMKRYGIDTRSLYCFRPEEDDHDDLPHWLFLTLLVRNAVLEMIKAGEISRLKALVSRWTTHDHLLPRRLALFAIAETAKLSKQARVPADWGAKSIIARPDILWTLESRREICRFLRKAGMGITPPTRDMLERVIRKGPPPPRSMYCNDISEEDIVKAMRRNIAIHLAKLGISAPLSPESACVLRLACEAEPKTNFERYPEYYSSKGEPFWERGEQAAPDWTKMSAKECTGFIQSAKWLNLNALVKEHSDKAVESFEILAKKKFWERDKWSLFLTEFGRNADIPEKIAVRLVRLLEVMPKKLALALVRDCAYVMQAVSHVLPFSKMEKAWRRAWEFDLDPSSGISSNHHISQLDIAINHTHGQLAEVPLICFRHKKEREKLKCVFAAILASNKKSHEHGKILIASRLSMLFHNSPEWAKWTKQHLLPFFAPEDPMAFGMWEAFLYHPTVSVDLLDALKPGLVHFLKCADTFDGRASNLVGIFVIGCQMHPGILSRNEKRRIVAGMNPKGIQYFCRHMERELRERDQNGATLAKAWEELVFPFLREIWPEKILPPNQASDISQALASVIMLTGDAFPKAFEWAKDFLSPIIGHSRGHPITDLCYGHHQQDENIPKKFPQECLQFLRQIIPDDNFGHRYYLRVLLDKIKANNPELERHLDFIHLREIASGG